jgi:hypothetical protein
MLSKLFNHSNLQRRLLELEAENSLLKERLHQKQVQINQTNAYYKGLMRKKTSSPKK